MLRAILDCSAEVCVCTGQFVIAVHAWLTDSQATVCIHSPYTDAAGQIRMSFQSTVTVMVTENLSIEKT